MRLNFSLFNEAGDAGAGGGAAAAPAAGTIFGATPAEGSSQQQQAAALAAGAGAPAAWSWAKEDGAFNDGWQDKLPDDLRTSPSLRTIGSLPDLAKAYVATKSMVGQKLEMPGEGATPEQVANWRKVTGAPDKPEGYLGSAKSLRPEALPEELWDAKSEGQFLAIAHKHGLPPAAVKDIMGFYGQSLVDGLKQSQGDAAVTVQAEAAKLRQEWGKDFDANLHAAATVAGMVGIKTDNPAFTNSDVVKAFAQMSKLISGDKLVSGEIPSAMTSARERAQDIQDPKSTSILAREYRGEFGPERQGAAQKMLHQIQATIQPAQ